MKSKVYGKMLSFNGNITLNKKYFHIKCKKDTKSLKNNMFDIIRLVLPITEHLKRNVQTSIVPFLQNILMQQY